MSEHTYQDLIEEAFIEPIRSVLIVDDEYPTLHDVLLEPEEREAKFSSKGWDKTTDSRDQVRRIIERFRQSETPYLLDIHDGTSPIEEKDEELVGNLQQTDLLILDYELDKNNEGNGSAAVRIAQKALLNKHFNLILVHTKEPLERVFHEFLIGFLTPYFSTGSSIDPDGVLQGFLDVHEDELVAAVGDQQYAAARILMLENKPEVLRKAIHDGSAHWGEVKAIFEAGGLHRSKWMEAAFYALTVFEQEDLERFAKNDLDVVGWNEGPVQFIRALRGFFAFKSKRDEKDLMLNIREALCAWGPRPSRLMLTKLRAEMNERGIEVQDDALGDADVAAIWYLRLLRADKRNLNAVVETTVRNHSEQLLDQLLPRVCTFAKRIREVDAEGEPMETASKRFDLDLSDKTVRTKAKLGHNAFVGSKPVKSVHLELGHILAIGDDFWVCLTPACDMVPKRHRGQPYDRIEGLKRFTALKLVSRTPGEGLSVATRGGQIFANVSTGDGNTERRAFSVASELNASPAWMTMYVQDDGFLPDEGDPVCCVSYVSEPCPKCGPTIPVVVHTCARVCGMLRYEYALEIQSRFTASQSRIGLDFEQESEECEGGSKGNDR